MKRIHMIIAPAVLARARRMKVVGLMMLAFAFLTSSWFMPMARTQTNSAQRLAMIQRNGKLPGGAAYKALVEAKYGVTLTRARSAVSSADGSTGLTCLQVGGEPMGFCKSFQWDRKDDAILLALFINAADDLGVSISGLDRGDTIQVTSAAGISSFSEDKGNPLASSIVGLIATGGKAILTGTGNGEFIPALEAAETFAQEQFKPTNAKTKRRDAFGVDPGSGHKAKQEGGILISLPESGGPYYSGEPTSRWIKQDGTRTDENLPLHVQFGTAFFLRQGFNSHNTRTINSPGEIYVTPWDWKFDDNAGYYKVLLLIKKGNGGIMQPEPTIIQRRRRPGQ